MDEPDPDTLMRMAAFEHVRRLGEVHDHLTAAEFKPGFVFDGERIPLINPRRGIFKPQQMRFLLSIKTVFPKPGGKVWYDDQRDASVRHSITRYRSSISTASHPAVTRPCYRPSLRGGTARH